MGGTTSRNGNSKMPGDTYRIPHGDSNSSTQYFRTANPDRELWAGANEASPPYEPNAFFTRIEVHCPSLKQGKPPSAVGGRRSMRFTRATTHSYQTDLTDIAFHVLVQFAPLGKEGEVLVDYGDMYDKTKRRDYPYKPFTRVKPRKEVLRVKC